MRRKKTAKRPAKRSLVKKQVLSSKSESVEKDLQALPAKMYGLLQSEVLKSKQQKSQLNNQLAKEDKQFVVLNKRMQMLKNSKKSAANTKRLNAAKKAMAACTNAITRINKDLNIVNASIEKNLAKQAKMTALKKMLAAFEKEWMKMAKQRKVKSSKPTLSVVEAKHHDQPHVDQFANGAENHNVEHEAEATS